MRAGIQEKMRRSNALVILNECLRTEDNQLLKQASNHDGVLCIYLIDRSPIKLHGQQFEAKGLYARTFELEALKELELRLKQLRINLSVIPFEADAVFKLIEDYLIDTVYSALSIGPYEQQLKNLILEKTRGSLKWKEYPVQFLISPENIPFKINELPEVFTVFRKKIEKRLSIERPLPCIEELANNSLFQSHYLTLPSLDSFGYFLSEPDRRSAHPFKGGESEAIKRVQDYFFKRRLVSSYKKTRNGLIGEAYSTKFSGYLALGCISARSIYAALSAYESTVEKSEDTYWVLFELLWRDYFKFLGLKHRENLFKLGGIKERYYPWNNDKIAFEAWINGKTKDPFVNAIMLELKHTGFTSNRGRQNAASYWSKTLRQDWRVGAYYFQTQLIDNDVQSNWGNWNYISGVGNDPRDREFNTKLQAERYDPHQEFQKLWNK
ncbi:MAG: DASH family cryptochrome [Flavobacteriaceae bacterium]